MHLNLAVGTSDTLVSEERNLIVSLSTIKREVKFMRERLLGCTGNKSRSHQDKIGSVDLNVSLIGNFDGGVFGDDSSKFGSGFINVKVHVGWYVNEITFNWRQVDTPSVNVAPPVNIRKLFV